MNLKNKKIISLLLIVLSIGMIFAGCSANNNGDINNNGSAQLKLDKSFEDLVKEIQENVEMGMGTVDDGTMFKEVYKLDEAMFEDYILVVPMIVNADTIFIAKVNKDVKMDDAKAAAEKIRSQIQQGFENYLPEPLEMAKNGKIVSKGDYVMLIISSDNDKAVKLFEDSIN